MRRPTRRRAARPSSPESRAARTTSGTQPPARTRRGGLARARARARARTHRYDILARERGGGEQQRSQSERGAGHLGRQIYMHSRMRASRVSETPAMADSDSEMASDSKASVFGEEESESDESDVRCARVAVVCACGAPLGARGGGPRPRSRRVRALSAHARGSPGLRVLGRLPAEEEGAQATRAPKDGPFEGRCGSGGWRRRRCVRVPSTSRRSRGSRRRGDASREEEGRACGQGGGRGRGHWRWWWCGNGGRQDGGRERCAGRGAQSDAARQRAGCCMHRAAAAVAGTALRGPTAAAQIQRWRVCLSGTVRTGVRVVVACRRRPAADERTHARPAFVQRPR